MKQILFFLFLFILSINARAQYAFELEVGYSSRIKNTNEYSVSGKITKGKIEKGQKYYLTDGSEWTVNNVMSSKTATSVDIASLGEDVSIGITSNNFKPENNVILKGINTRPNYSGQQVRSYRDHLPDDFAQFKINGYKIKTHCFSKPVYTKADDILDMYFKEGDEVLWLRIGNLSKIENVPAQILCDSNLIGTKIPYARIVYMPKACLPTDMPNNCNAYEDKYGKSSILITTLKKYTYQLTCEFSGILRPNDKILLENPDAGMIQISEGRIDRISYDAH